MTALEKVMQLKRAGKGESEIITILKAEGMSPMEISDSINQSKIKEAISDPNPTEGMNPSIMSNDESTTPQNKKNIQPDQTYEPQPATTYEPQPQYDDYDTGSQYNNSYQDDYSNQDSYQDDYGGDIGSTDTIIEVAEQVFLEKMKGLTKEIKALTEFRTIFEIKVNNLTSRLERMEKIFDKMQLSILEKVGEYGRGINNVKKELQMVEDSISKLK